MNKKHLIKQLILELEVIHKTAITAAKRAHNTATDKENIAENKYDTLGLEAAYLAEGQAKRALECGAELEVIEKLTVKEYKNNDVIGIGALVGIIDGDNPKKLLLLAPVAGGLKFKFKQDTITVITPSSPLGRILIGKWLDDEFDLETAKGRTNYCICDIY